jgi:putative ABC transport system substrate-binding protein
MIRRREFITLLGGAAAAWPLAARAQQGDRMRRIGVLMNATATDAEFQSYVAAFVQGLHELGWTEGQNLRIDIRWNAGDAGLAQIYAAQLIGLMPDVILAMSTVNLTAIRQATNIVSVVFVQVNDPVAQGFVASTRQPGGNITGFSAFEFSMGGKWLNLLKEVAPGLEGVAVMFNPETAPYWKFYMQAIEAAASSLGVQAIAVPVRATSDIEPALASLAHQSNGGLMLLGDSFLVLRHSLIADLTSRFRLPSIGVASNAGSNYAKSGGLIDYSDTTNLVSQYHEAATYADRILKGEKPGDLPVQAVTHFKMIVNMKTAKALGLTVPPSLLAVADEVIE